MAKLCDPSRCVLPPFVTRSLAPTTATACVAGVLRVAWVLLLLLVTRDGSALGQATSPTLWGHFFVDGCSFSPDVNLTRDLPLSRLAGQGGFFLELDVNDPHTTLFTTAGSGTCTLPSSFFFRVTTERGQKKNITLTFTKVPVELDDTDDDDKMDDEEEDPGVGAEDKQCTLPSSSWVTLQSGYGFISCRGLEDRAEAVSSLLAWKDVVEENDAKISLTRTKVLGGVGGGMTLLILGCVVCAVVRIRSSRKPALDRRRPSQTSSIRIRLTSDGHLSSTKISN